jgi:hypothetical protein
MTSLRLARRISVRCPVAGKTLQSLSRGETSALAADPVIAPILAAIEAHPEFGDFGAYGGVCEFTVGVEAFTPGTGADPTLGVPGQRTLCGTVTLTTFVADETPEIRLEALIDTLAAAHPWELPVIEVDTVRLYARITDKTSAVAIPQISD